MDVASYMRRLGYFGPQSPTLETLRALHRSHMCAVPFENLDIVPLHRRIRLEQQALQDKILERRRGGFCYELNGLFAALLQQLGFEVRHLNARVFGSGGKLGMDFDHLALLVNGRWLADVGFGDSFIEPLELRVGEQAQDLRAYRLEPVGEEFILWQRDYDGTWRRQYLFDLAPRRFPEDYAAACAYHQRSPESHFTRQPIVSRAT